jgi:peptidyl-prolyl cis-trans isomerase SurA
MIKPKMNSISDTPHFGYSCRERGPVPPGAWLARALILVAILAWISGCSRQAAPSADVWAEVDGKGITREQVERQYRNRMNAGSDAGNREQELSFMLNILDELISNQILLAHAAHARITVSEAEVDNRIAQLRSPYTDEEFQKKLADQGMTLADLRTQVRDSLIVTKLTNKEIESRITVSDAEIKAYYEHNKANYSVPETEYHVAQIQVTPQADPQVHNLKNDDAASPLAAERKIQALYARLRAGEDFATVAEEYSEDPRTASGGGDMGFIPASSLQSNPQLKNAVLSLQVGGVSGIIQTPSGFHIIKLLGIENAGQHELSDPQVESAIRGTLMNEKEQLLKAAYIEDLRNRAKIVNYLAQKIVSTGGVPEGFK